MQSIDLQEHSEPQDFKSRILAWHQHSAASLHQDSVKGTAGLQASSCSNKRTAAVAFTTGSEINSSSENDGSDSSEEELDESVLNFLSQFDASLLEDWEPPDAFSAVVSSSTVVRNNLS